MKKALSVFCLLCVICLASGGVSAQEKQKAKISLQKKVGKTVNLTVTSPEEFYMGGNKHILYIGNKHFDLYDQQNDEGKGSQGHKRWYTRVYVVRGAGF